MANQYKRIGARLRSLREDRDETQADLARILGVTPEAVGHYERGRSRIAVVDLQKIADHYGVRLSYFVGRETESDRVQGELEQIIRRLDQTYHRLQEVIPYSGEWVWLPLIGSVPAGCPEWREAEDAEEFYPCAAHAIRDRERAFAVRVAGNSMVSRGILQGDIVFVDTVGEPKPGDIVIAGTDDEVVMRIYKQDEKGAYLQAGNEGYPILRMRNARIVGVVVGSYREKP